MWGLEITSAEVVRETMEPRWLWICLMVMVDGDGGWIMMNDAMCFLFAREQRGKSNHCIVTLHGYRKEIAPTP